MSNTPMAIAAHELALVCDEMDESPDKIDRFLDRFEDAKLTLGDAVDRRIAVDREIKSQIAAHEVGIRHYRDRKAMLEEIHERFRSRTKVLMMLVDEGIRDAFRGKLGKITLAKVASVKFAFGENRPMSAASVEKYGILHDYLVPVMSYKVDTDLVRQELELGKKLAWAHLEHGILRFPSAPKAKQLEEGAGDE